MKYRMQILKPDENNDYDAGDGWKITSVIRGIENPKQGVSPAMRKKFNAHSTEEERARMRSFGQ